MSLAYVRSMNTLEAEADRREGDKRSCKKDSLYHGPCIMVKTPPHTTITQFKMHNLDPLTTEKNRNCSCLFFVFFR